MANNGSSNTKSVRLSEGGEKRKTTTAEYHREYRARKKAERLQQVEDDPGSHAGVAIYHNKDDQYHIVTPHLDIKAPYSSNSDVTISSSPRVGDICAVQCELKNNGNNSQKLILIAVYISPNTAMRDIKIFLGKALLPLSTLGAQALAQMLGEPVDYNIQPVILAGDFDVNFSLPEAEPLLKFLKDNFSLDMINGKNDPTTKGGTTIDAVFARNIDNLECKHFISYFSYHNPIVNVVDLNNDG